MGVHRGLQQKAEAALLALMGLQSMGSVLASILVVMPDALTGALEGAVNSLEAASVFQVKRRAAALQ